MDEGSRVVIVRGVEIEPERFDERFAAHEDYKTGRTLKYNLPSGPETGLYTVFKKTGDKRGYRDPRGYGERVMELLTIRYNPGDEVRNMWDRWDDGHERKNRISYNIMKSDDFVINFDEVASKDIDYYLDSRLDRKEYLTIMPLLWEVREQKKAEETQEHDFLLMLIAPLAGKASQEELLAAAQEDMRWWKLKNKWKRGLKADDAKAFRMIGARLKTRFK